ncbi:hypothetical protein BDV30DRAFT_229612 [Aspergillus minisclerotigenes]|uniref:Uncharacterized protein n=1 Tax=Aspergillus minisclerotigenes TaxID=656917 RepID=A0A5N6IT69_9EURO|nr:hypothetical protein BDV30DRAFT_229612 [Aspergillus minisclerotigenes]
MVGALRCPNCSDFSRFSLVVVINQQARHSLVEYIKGSHPAWVSHFGRNDYHAIYCIHAAYTSRVAIAWIRFVSTEGLPHDSWWWHNQGVNTSKDVQPYSLSTSLAAATSGYRRFVRTAGRISMYIPPDAWRSIMFGFKVARPGCYCHTSTVFSA